MTPQQVQEWFERIGQRRVTLQRLRDRREALESPLGSSSQQAVRGGGIGDPTARAAMALIDARDDEAELERELRAEVEQCRRVCAGVGRAISAEYGIVLDDHYISGITWGTIAQAIRVSIATVYRMRDLSFDYIATVGLRRAEEGVTIGDWMEHRQLARG